MNAARLSDICTVCVLNYFMSAEFSVVKHEPGWAVQTVEENREWSVWLRIHGQTYDHRQNTVHEANLHHRRGTVTGIRDAINDHRVCNEFMLKFTC